MIITMVRFPPREPVSVTDARILFGSNAASYLDVPGLLWKAYLRSDDGTRVGGVYWWADRNSAESMFSADWRAGMVDKYGAEPTVEYFDAPVVVDGLRQALFTKAPLDTRTP